MPATMLLLAFLLLPLAVADAFSPSSPLSGAVHHHCRRRTTGLSRCGKTNRPATFKKAKTPFTLAWKENPAHVRRMPLLTVAENEGGEDTNLSSLSSKRETLGLIMWLLAICTFIAVNVKVEPFPKNLLLALSRQQWSLVHAISSMMFGGTILLSTLIENLVVSSQNKSVVKFWFLSVPRLDSMVVLPALTGSIISGIGQATIDYGGMMGAPKHVTGAVHALLTFGLWWGATDVTTQERAKELARSLDGGEDFDALEVDGDAIQLFKLRRISNIVSCLMVAGLYALMVLKPGFGS